MTTPTDLHARLLAILNEDLSPWTFTGDEPMVVRLFAVLDEAIAASDGLVVALQASRAAWIHTEVADECKAAIATAIRQEPAPEPRIDGAAVPSLGEGDEWREIDLPEMRPVFKWRCWFGFHRWMLLPSPSGTWNCPRCGRLEPPSRLWVKVTKEAP